MPHHTEFRLSELYLACRNLGARHPLTREVLAHVVRLANPAMLDQVMKAPQTYGESQIIPFRRHPVDLQFACALAALSRAGNMLSRQGFMVCSDDALGFMGALSMSTSKLTYSLHEKPLTPAVLEEHDVFRALEALSKRTITQATLTPDAEKPDTLHIDLPVSLMTLGKNEKSFKELQSFHCRVFPPHGNPEVLKHLRILPQSVSRVRIEIGTQHLMVCHHAGMQRLAFELVTPAFALRGQFPDMLDTPQAYKVRHTPVRLFHDIFKGLDERPISLPEPTATELRMNLHWLDSPEYAT